MKTLLLIDANSIVHRSFHALPPLTSKDGKPIQSVYGISSILLKLWREDKSFDGTQGKPDYAAALFDRPEPTFREKKYAEYKAQRPTAPDELISQIIEAHNLFPAFGIKTLESAGYEADDLIATLAEKFRKEPDLKIVILTGDLDTLQLVEGDKVVVRTFKKGISDTTIYDEKSVEERYGLKPAQLTDYKGLVGDPSDNIKGVPGVGPKTAAEILKKYGTLEKAYENLAEDEKMAKKLAPYKKEAELAKNLVTLERNVPVDIKGIEELEIYPPRFSEGKLRRASGNEKIREYFTKMGFETLIKRLEGGAGDAKEAKEAGQGQIFEASVKKKDRRNSVLIEDSFGVERYSGDYASKKLKVGFGLKNLIKALWHKRKDLAPPYFDLSVAFWLLDPDFKNYEPAVIFPKFLKRKWTGGAADLEVAYEFCEEKLEQHKLAGVFNDLEMPLLRILAEMENFGVAIAAEKLKSLEKEILEKTEELAKSIYKEAGEEFNINSPQKVSEVLFQKLQINGRAAPRTKTGLRSTRAENLEGLVRAHPIVPLILEYRESFKILSTYARPLQELTGRDGRLHTDFVQWGTGTGRLSSQAPNLQNIPQESAWAKPLRSAFVAPRGFSLLALDYSQLELRLLAHLSRDPQLMKSFREGLDIHKLTASKVLGLPLGKIGESERRLAKILNFGLIYGMGANSFTKTSGVTLGEAKEFIGNYFREFKEVRRWQEDVRTHSRTFGYAETPLGRRRYLWGLATNTPRLIAEAERAAVNFPIQGFNADIIKMAMIRCRELLGQKKLWGEGVKMTLSIHDELLFEVRDDIIETIAEPLRETMEKIYALAVPLVVEVSSGKDWGHLMDLKQRGR